MLTIFHCHHSLQQTHVQTTHAYPSLSAHTCPIQFLQHLYVCEAHFKYMWSTCQAHAVLIWNVYHMLSYLAYVWSVHGKELFDHHWWIVEDFSIYLHGICIMCYRRCSSFSVHHFKRILFCYRLAYTDMVIAYTTVYTDFPLQLPWGVPLAGSTQPKKKVHNFCVSFLTGCH